MNLEITNKIIKNKLYCQELEKLSILEKDRIFCRHDIEHFMSVARIAVIMCCEKSIEAEPDIIYAAALLHDIGRCEEYTAGIPHDIAGREIAEKILSETGCDEDIKAKIISLIISHRNKNNAENSLESIFYAADKKSRLCFCCPAQAQCNWSCEKKNLNIEV